MKTKNKRNKRKNKRNKTKKGGHKVHYDYQENIDAGTNKPLTGKHVHENNCVACVMRSLGYMTENTARFLQHIYPDGPTINMILDMVNTTYGPGHTFRLYEDEEDIKEYLQPGEATLSFLHRAGATVNNKGHCVIMFRSENGNLYVIDSQQHLVTPILDYLKHFGTSRLYLLTDPDIKQRPKYKFIIPEVIRKSIEKFRVPEPEI